MKHWLKCVFLMKRVLTTESVWYVVLLNTIFPLTEPSSWESWDETRLRVTKRKGFNQDELNDTMAEVCRLWLLLLSEWEQDSLVSLVEGEWIDKLLKTIRSLNINFTFRQCVDWPNTIGFVSVRVAIGFVVSPSQFIWIESIPYRNAESWNLCCHSDVKSVRRIWRQLPVFWFSILKVTLVTLENSALHLGQISCIFHSKQPKNWSCFAFGTASIFYQRVSV